MKVLPARSASAAAHAGCQHVNFKESVMALQGLIIRSLSAQSQAGSPA
jgi:hypothetical protein